jgi:hypothetical protein
MAKGSIAKEVITKKLKEAFGADFIGEVDKKIYIQAPENGEMVQIAISMTCPKTPVAVSNAPVVKGGIMDFEAEPVLVAPKSVEVSEDERATIQDMMRRLGL